MAKMFKPLSVGETVGQVRLKNIYDHFAPDVLVDHLDLLQPKKSRRRGLYKVVRTLPGIGEYVEMKEKKYTRTVADVIDDAKGEIESLTDEVRSWYDSLPESLQGADRGTMLDEAASNLENIRLDDPLSVCKLIRVIVYPTLGSDSRASRAAGVASELRRVAEAIGDFTKMLKPSDDSGFEIHTAFGVLDVYWNDLRSCVEELEEAANALEEVEFPGMYG